MATDMKQTVQDEEHPYQATDISQERLGFLESIGALKEQFDSQATTLEVSLRGMIGMPLMSRKQNAALARLFLAQSELHDQVAEMVAKYFDRELEEGEKVVL